jgi:hypothetical protein
MKNVWLVLTTLRSTSESDLPGPPGSKVFVEFYYSCNSIYDALRTVEETVKDLNFSLERIVRVVSANLDDWDFKEHPSNGEFRIFCERVYESSEIGYGPFSFAGDGKDGLSS